MIHQIHKTENQNNTQHIIQNNSKGQQKMYVKKSNLNRIGSAVNSRVPSAHQQKEKSLKKLLGLKNESSGDKYFSTAQKLKGQKSSHIDNFNELDEMIHNYLYTKQVAQNTKGVISGGPLINTKSEKLIRNFNQFDTDLQIEQIYEIMHEKNNNIGPSCSPSQALDDRSKRNKEIYNNLAKNFEYNLMNNQIGSQSHKNQDNRQSFSKRMQEEKISNGNQYNQLSSTGHLNRIPSSTFISQQNYTNSKLSNGHLNQDNSSNILDNNTTNNTISIRGSKINSTSQNTPQGSSTPNYAMGTIVSNNKTNQARRFSKSRPVTAANTKAWLLQDIQYKDVDPSPSTIKPWLRHELFTKKQKGELIDEFEQKQMFDKNNFQQDQKENEQYQSYSNQQKNQKGGDIESSESCKNDDFEDCTDTQKNSNNRNIKKIDGLSKTAGSGFTGYQKLFRSESNKVSQSKCDNILKDCENILNKIQKRDGQQINSSQNNENLGQSQKDAYKNQLGESLRNSYRTLSNPRPQSVKKITSNNLFGELGFEDEFLAKQDDDIMTQQKAFNQSLKKKIGFKENICDEEEKSPQQFGQQTNNFKGSLSVKGTNQKIQISQYPHLKLQKEKGRSEENNYGDQHQLSQIQEQQEGDGLQMFDKDDQTLKQTPNTFKKNNILPRSQSTEKLRNSIRFYDTNDKGVFTPKSTLTEKENFAQEALKTANIIAKNIQKLSGNNPNNNQITILQRPESKRHTTTATIIQQTGTIKDKKDQIDQENIKYNLRLSQNNDQQNKYDENQDEKRHPLQQNNKQLRPATAAIQKSSSLPNELNNISSVKQMERYEIKSIIGKGSYAVVKLAKDTTTDKNVAIKMYDKYKLADTQKRNNVKREVAILNKLDHVNIIKLYQTIDTRSSVNLVMEYISSQSLRQFMKDLDGRQLEERIAKTIFKQLVSAVQYCHDWEVIHRDIKLENVMLDVNNGHQIKLIDFGFAIRIPAEKKLNIFCGTPSYMSPEITKKREYFGKPADIWSLGVVLFALICGRFPFKGKDDNDLFRKIQNCDFKISSSAGISASKLIHKILRQNPNERPTAKEILQDKWFTE